MYVSCWVSRAPISLPVVPQLLLHHSSWVLFDAAPGLRVALLRFLLSHFAAIYGGLRRIAGVSCHVGLSLCTPLFRVPVRCRAGRTFSVAVEAPGHAFRALPSLCP